MTPQTIPVSNPKQAAAETERSHEMEAMGSARAVDHNLTTSSHNFNRHLAQLEAGVGKKTTGFFCADSSRHGLGRQVMAMGGKA